MYYYSLNRNAKEVSFKEAVINGIAEDKGLYFPKSIHKLDDDFLNNIQNYSDVEIAFTSIKQFIGDEIPDDILKEIINKTLCFNFPLLNIENNVNVLELFHGPTMAFKDVGARFMAQCLSYFNAEDHKKLTVLVATSGDTGGAVASGFLNLENINVVILYPSKKVSEVQEKQLTTLGKNIFALEVNGNFDDCQTMVKRAFLDTSITSFIQLTSANSINIARWLPQMFYFFYAYKLLKETNKKIVFSIPSGNFGNISAGMMTKHLGLPVHHFIAATNVNDIVPVYLNTKNYIPKPSIQTISNAMDVGNPSNFIRIQKIYDNDYDALKKDLYAYSFTDDETRETILKLYKNYKYIADPHGAVAYLGLKKYQQENPNCIGVFLETAHPVKFLDVISPLINQTIEYPHQIKQVINKAKKSTFINSYDELKSFLLNN